MSRQPLHLDLSVPVDRVELTRFAPLRQLVKARGLQFWLILPGLTGFVLVILTGLWGTRVGSANFSIIFVWIVWWAALIMLLIPLGGRAWCAMCPIPAPGEWLQRRAFIRKGREKPLALVARHWPKRFKNIWLQNAAFLGVALFSAIILTRPVATAVVLLAFIGAAVALHLVYGKRVFCRYVCPVGGFVGLYAMVAPLEIRVKDPQVCRTHKEKECLRGSATAYGCPWLEYPGTMARNTYCGMCTECLKACPKDNVAINLRPFGQDLLVAGERRLDEAYKAFIMLTCAGVYSAVMMGPWGWLKDWANLDNLPGFAAYAVLFLGANLLVVPGLYYLATSAGRRLAGARRRPSTWWFISPTRWCQWG
jgi:polyferredoxin